MKGAPIAVLGVLGLLLPVLVVAVLGAGSAPTAQAAAADGLTAGAALAPGSVPAAFADLVTRAGTVCPAAPAPGPRGAGRAGIRVEPGSGIPGRCGGDRAVPADHLAVVVVAGAEPVRPGRCHPGPGPLRLRDRRPRWPPGRQQGRLPAGLSLTALMLAGYNAGPAAVLSAGGIPANGQTPDYVARITARAPHFAAASSVPSGSFAAAVVAAAESQLGVPYAWDGGSVTGPTPGQCVPGAAANDCHVTGWDCSGW